MYDDLLLKYITVAGISWRQSNCDSRDVGKLCETRKTDFSRGGAQGQCYKIHEKSLAGIDEVVWDQLTLLSSELDVAEKRFQLVDNLSHLLSVSKLFFPLLFSSEIIFAGKFSSQGLASESNEDALEQLFQNFLFTSVLITRRSEEAHETR